jgi:hypothetical protein
VKRFEGVDDLHEVRSPGGRAEDPEAQRPLDAARIGIRPVEHTIKLLDSGRHVAPEPLAEPSEFDPSARAVNELGAELFFERAEGSG